MTRDEILAMPAGREMDALIAQYVFGWKLRYVPKDARGENQGFVLVSAVISDALDDARIDYPKIGALPTYYYCRDWSTNIQSAWEVVQYFVVRNKRPEIVRGPEHEWFVQLDDFNEESAVYEENICIAICRAALLAVME